MKRFLLSLFSVSALSAAPPNIVMILADDMGYGDLGCTGSQLIKTPNIDSIASEGILCTQAYVPSSVCSPSRAGILTGRDPRRFGYEGNLNKSADFYPTRPTLQGLPPSEHTMGDHLKSVGYETALIGKWHQGTNEVFHPNIRGFDHFMGMLSGSHNYFITDEKHHLEENGVPVEKVSSTYVTDFFTDEALLWMKERPKKEESPFFIFLSYNAPHTPMQATEEDLAVYAHVEDKKRQTYAAMMHALDRGVGRVIDHLKATGQFENTLIVFFSDNGGASNNASWNGPLAGRKGSLLEGGVRVPLLVSWPSKLPKGKTHTGPVSALDLLPTFMAAAEAKLLPLKEAPKYEDKKNRKRAEKLYGAYDGQDLLPILSGSKEAKARTFFWRLQGQSAILSGDHKLIKLSHRPAQLFAPSIDPGERNDLTSSESAKVSELFQLLGEWENSLATVPLWDSSPFWSKESAQTYDKKVPIPEPK
ncbi:sulfatase-like hydrolase/transferase [bacterium]|nr:sulfatase-like hydrolase/transferase [bacterium]